MQPTMKASGAGFTLIELLCVVAIIAILAALLLPALSQAGAQARRVQCMHQLHQVGIAFQEFAHDHNSQFPMSVPMSSGGSQEFAENSYRLSGQFYFGYRHFQTLSNELVTPKPLACPTDTRAPALSFAALQNSNLSFFVGLNADYGKPTSILAGDRNITNDWAGPVALQHLGPNYFLRWTRELHHYKGNLLFADGHVEDRIRAALLPVHDQFPETADLVLPTPDPGNGTGVGGSSGGAGGVGGAGAPSTAAPSHGGSGGVRHTNAAPAPGGLAPAWAVPASQTQRTLIGTLSLTNGNAAANSETNTAAAPFEAGSAFTGLLSRIPWWVCNLLLLLVLSVVAELYRRERAKARRPWLRPDYARSQNQYDRKGRF